MATKTFYVTRDMKHPLYRNRMLRAGDPLELDGPTANLYRRLKVITEEKPKPAEKVAATPPVTPPPAAPKAAAPTRKPAAKRTTRRKK